MLEMKAECERCHDQLAPDASAFICSYECTFCPNCAGELVPRPRRVTGAN
ncbi:MAG: DUF1272 domain-containing protein [Actinobacteria bacterium]|nr:DUF1272 domain-containing protein [Actinomycetota bacterium]